MAASAPAETSAKAGVTKTETAKAGVNKAKTVETWAQKSLFEIRS